jgi:hypothetical protein
VNLRGEGGLYQFMELAGYKPEDLGRIMGFSAHDMKLWELGHLFVVEGYEEKLSRGIQQIRRALQEDWECMLMPPQIREVDGEKTIRMDEFKVRMIFKKKAYLDGWADVVYQPAPSVQSSSDKRKTSLVD